MINKRIYDHLFGNKIVKTIETDWIETS